MTQPTILKIDKYCSEIDWDEHLKENVINLVVAPTSSGKTTSFLNKSKTQSTVAFVAPYVSITNQVKLNYPEMDIKTGLKATEEDLNLEEGRITSFHSIPKMLELKTIDLLVIDEIHVLTSYAGYTRGMLSTFWETIQQLKIKHPQMKIVALTGTPHFIRLCNFLNFNMIVIKPKVLLAKPSEIFISRSWTKELLKNESYIYLYASKKQGQQQANKYHGIYLDSANKESLPEYSEILQGKMPCSKLFTSTVLSTGISILDPVRTIYTNWMDLIDIIQMSARVRQGGHNLKITQMVPFFLKNGMDKPRLDWVDSFEVNMQILHQYQTWYSYMVHNYGDEGDMFNIFYQMLYLPEENLPQLD